MYIFKTKKVTTVPVVPRVTVNFKLCQARQFFLKSQIFRDSDG